MPVNASRRSDPRMSNIGAVVFDMGGVLVDLQPITHLFGAEDKTVDESVEANWARWLASPSVRDYEMGHCDLETFATRFVGEAHLNCTANEFIQRFRSWPNGLFRGAAELVGSLRPDIHTAILSNTNSLHWHEQRDATAITKLCDREYLSFELGLAKPDAAIFEHVIADLGYEPSEILFLDDNQINVDAARHVGIDAVIARGVGEATAALALRHLIQ